MNVDLPEAWKSVLQHSLASDSFAELRRFVDQERSQHEIYPSDEDLFNAFRLTLPDRVKAVILGQDPYHGVDQAHGLAFSVQSGVKLPPSLKNIFKELEADLDVVSPAKGDLTGWAEQGVLLLNTVLTVRADQAHSHRARGWEEFTDSVIRYLGNRIQHTVFILWGKPAEAKSGLIDSTRHTVIVSPHPSPLSARRGFFKSRPFSRTNSALEQHGQLPIRWI